MVVWGRRGRFGDWDRGDLRGVEGGVDDEVLVADVCEGYGCDLEDES